MLTAPWPPPTNRPRPTSTPSWRTGSAAPPASTSPATRPATAPTSACAPRSAGRRTGWTSRRTSTASTSGPRPRPTSAPSSSPPRPTAPPARGSLTNGATQGNHAVCLALAPLGAPVVVQRNCHASVIDGLVLSGGLPTWVAPQYEPVLGMAHGVTPESLKAALDATPGARAAFIVSPTYYGMAADVEGCAEVAHAAGVPLVVDQSWGPHLGFHEDLPAERALARRRRDAHVGPQDRGLAHAVRAAARERLRPREPGRDRPHAAARALHVARPRC